MKAQRRFLQRVAAAAILASAAAVAGTSAGQAQGAYPDHEVTMVVPFEPGGGSDTFARIVSEALATKIGQPIIIDNRPGASTNIGAKHAADSDPDGYTLYFAAPNFAVNPSLFKELPFDPINDFAPVSALGAAPAVLTVHKDVPANTLKELIDLAKSKPGELNYATTGRGSGSSMAAELFRTMAEIDAVNIPFNGSSSAITALLAGQVDFAMNSAVAVMPHITNGSVKPLGVSTSVRSSALPDVPTIAEAGLPGYETGTWYGILAPAGTPKEVIDKLNADVGAIMADPAVKAKLAEQGIEPINGTPEQFTEFLKAEIAKWAVVAEKAGIEKE